MYQWYVDAFVKKIRVSDVKILREMLQENERRRQKRRKRRTRRIRRRRRRSDLNIKRWRCKQLDTLKHRNHAVEVFHEPLPFLRAQTRDAMTSIRISSTDRPSQYCARVRDGACRRRFGTKRRKPGVSNAAEGGTAEAGLGLGLCLRSREQGKVILVQQ